MRGLPILASIALLLGMFGTEAAELPILHEGEAPQVGHARVYRQTDVPVYRYDILKTYAHDTTDYTEALFFHNGLLYEGTGRYGQSWIKVWDLASGDVLRKVCARGPLFRRGRRRRRRQAGAPVLHLEHRVHLRPGDAGAAPRPSATRTRDGG